MIPEAIRNRLTRSALRYYLEERIGFRLRRRELIFRERELQPQDAETSPCTGRYQMRWIDAAELAGADFPDGFISKERAVRWLREKPCKLVAVFDGYRVIGSCWLEMQYIDFDFLDTRCPLAPADVYVSKLAVLPGHRFGLGKALMSAAISEAWRMGYRRIIGSHVPGNAKVEAIYAAQDWSRFQRVYYLRVGLLRRYVIADENGNGRRTYYSARAAAGVIPTLYARVR